MRGRGPLVMGLCLLLSCEAFAQADRRSEVTMKRAPGQGGQLEYDVQGEGEPVLLIHGSVIAASYVPIMGAPALAGYRLIRYHRRGYAGSTKPDPGAPVSIREQSADAIALLRDLSIERAHVVGHSYGAVIALQLALDAPQVVHSLTLLEPAKVGFVPSGPDFAKQTIEPALARYRAGDRNGALDVFMRNVVGANWKSALAYAIPGSPEQAERDVRTLFEIELPALGEWEFDMQKARTLSQPILHVVGSESLPIFHESRKVLHSWLPLPQLEDLTVPGAAHGLHQMGGRHSTAVAHGIATFLHRHPIDLLER